MMVIKDFASRNREKGGGRGMIFGGGCLVMGTMETSGVW